VIAAAVLTILVVTGRGGFEYDDPFDDLSIRLELQADCLAGAFAVAEP
jgi:predicted metalloprotease